LGIFIDDELLADSLQKNKKNTGSGKTGSA
jgi:hypothetical protein